MSGFIKIHRDLERWGWAESPKHFRVWIHLLLKANWSETEYKGHKIEAGSLVAGRKKISANTGLSEQSVRTVLRDLKSTNEITIKNCGIFSIISIVNWHKYQDANQMTHQQNNQRTNQQVTTYKENKKKEIRNNNAHFDFEAVYQKYPLKKGKSRGMKKIQREIKRPEDFERFSRAVENYAGEVKNTEPRFIKHFSTFVAEWEDWTEYKSITSLDRAMQFLGEGEIND